MILTKEEALSYNGGGQISTSMALILAAAGSFLLGLLDGFTNPQACNRYR